MLNNNKAIEELYTQIEILGSTHNMLQGAINNLTKIHKIQNEFLNNAIYQHILQNNMQEIELIQGQNMSNFDNCQTAIQDFIHSNYFANN